MKFDNVAIAELLKWDLILIHLVIDILHNYSSDLSE